MRRHFKSYRWLILAAILTGVIVGGRVWREHRRMDDDGRQPQDIARAFVEAVNAGNFEKAATCWRPGDVQNIEANIHGPFRDFCLHFFKCDTFDVTLIGKDKKSHVVAFRGHENGEPKTFGLFLKRVDGKWRLVMNRFIPEEESAKSSGPN